MSLKQMLDFKPSDEDMAMLDLDVVIYIKVSMVSILKEINYNFIRYLFAHEQKDDFISTMKNINSTIFYDFEYQNGDDKRAITIFELYSNKTYTETEMLIKEMLADYTHDAEVIFDFYTHDNHEYRLTNIDGVVSTDQLK